MADRKLRADFDENDLYLKGYLYARIMSGDAPKYGYQGNRLPKTSGKSRKTESIFRLAKKRESTQ